jgi:hypothetical protein
MCKLVIHLSNFPYQTITCNKIIHFLDYYNFKQTITCNKIIGFPDYYNFKQTITCNKIIGFPDYYNFNQTITITCDCLLKIIII